jgi:hypothetical protein
MSYSPTERNDIQDEIRADAEQRNAKALAEFRTLVDWALISCKDILENAVSDDESADWLTVCRRLRNAAMGAKDELSELGVGA